MNKTICNQQKSAKEKLKEPKLAINRFNQHRYSRRSLSERSVILNWTEVAAVIGASRMSVWRYRQAFPPPPLPAFKSTITDWAEKYGLSRKRGPFPKDAG